jgi:hypothetical protein
MEDLFQLGDRCLLFKKYLKYFYSKKNATKDALKYEESLERFIIIRNLFPWTGENRE